MSAESLLARAQATVRADWYGPSCPCGSGPLDPAVAAAVLAAAAAAGGIDHGSHG